MHEEETHAYEQLDQILEETDVAAAATEGIDYTKDFIWGSDQDEYIDES